MQIKEYVKQELKKIAFFIQNAGLFDLFPTRSSNALQDLPVEWKTVQTEGEFIPEWGNGRKTFKDAYLSGLIKDKELKLQIRASNDRNVYKLEYEGKKYSLTSLTKLTQTIENLAAGGIPRPKTLLDSYQLFKNKKSEIYNYIKEHYLYFTVEEPWELEITKQGSNYIWLRFFVTSETVKRDRIEAKLKEHGDHRMVGVTSFVKAFLAKNEIDPNKLNFEYTLIEKPENEAGFIVTIS